MAQIPYGYRIEKGSIVIDTEAAVKIDRFVKLYLSGLSVKEAKKASEIPLSESTLNHLLKNEVYLGLGIFPPLMTAEVFYLVQEERMRRTHPATTKPADPVPVRSRFVFYGDNQDTVTAGAARKATTEATEEDGAARVGAAGATEEAGAARTASLLYSMNTASPDGRETATPAEISQMRRTADKMIRVSTESRDERRPTWQ